MKRDPKPASIYQGTWPYRPRHITASPCTCAYCQDQRRFWRVFGFLALLAIAAGAIAAIWPLIRA